MTRKHFKMMAESIAVMTDREAAQAMADAFIKVARASNPRFNTYIFLSACGL
jgi:hypothetical protein